MLAWYEVIMDLNDLADRIVGKELIGLQVDGETETITLEFDDYDVDITGDGLGMKLFELQKPRLN